MSSEDLFYQKVRDLAYDYAPEVPASVYAGMRSKYRKSRFFTWSASSLNVWYVAALVLLTAFAAYTMFPQNHSAQQAVSNPLKGVSLRANLNTDNCASNNHAEMSSGIASPVTALKCEKAAPYCVGKLDTDKAAEANTINKETLSAEENTIQAAIKTPTDASNLEEQIIEQQPKIEIEEKEKPKKVWRTKVYKDK